MVDWFVFDSLPFLTATSGDPVWQLLLMLLKALVGRLPFAEQLVGRLHPLLSGQGWPKSGRASVIKPARAAHEPRSRTIATPLAHRVKESEMKQIASSIASSSQH